MFSEVFIINYGMNTHTEADLTLNWYFGTDFSLFNWMCAIPGGLTLLVIPACEDKPFRLYARTDNSSNQPFNWNSNRKIRMWAWLPFIFSKGSLENAMTEVANGQLNDLFSALKSQKQLMFNEGWQPKPLSAPAHSRSGAAIGTQERLAVGGANGQQQSADSEESIAIIDRDEAAIAQAQFADLKKRGEIYLDSALSQELSKRANGILANWPTKPRGLTYRFHFLRSAEPNAFSLPNGAIFFTEAMVNKLISIGGWDGVIAHEIAHTEERHAARSLRALQEAAAARRFGGVLAGLALGVLANDPSVMDSASNFRTPDPLQKSVQHSRPRSVGAAVFRDS